MSHNPLRRVTIRYELDDPALTQAAYELIQTHAKANNLHENDRVDVVLEVAVMGNVYDAQIENFKAAFRQNVNASVGIELMDESPAGNHVVVSRER